jgi:oligosaccharide repeat unit polymerase
MSEPDLFYVVTVSSAAIAIFFFLYFKSNKISVANPSNIASIGWLFPFAITPLLILSPYYETWRPGLNLYVFVNLAYFLFVFGNFIGYSIIKPKMIVDVEKNRSEYPVVSMNKFRNHAYVVFLAGMIGYSNNILNIVNAGGITVYTELGMREAELAFGSNTLMNYLYFLNMLALLMFVYLRYVYNDTRKGDLLIILISCVALISHGVKGTIVWPLVMALILIHMNRKTIFWSVLWPALFTVTVIFLIVTLGRQLPNLVAGTSDVDEWLVRGLLNFPLYFSTGFVNLEIELEKFTEFAFGMNTLAPFYEVFSFFTGNRQSLEITAATEELLYFHGYNTATFLRDPFRDFGVFGIALFSILYGLITSLLFGISSRSKNPYAIIAYSIYAAAVFGMFFSNHFQKIQYIFLVMICFFLASLNRRRPKHY